MPTRVAPPVDADWAKSLKGLPILIPDNWWNGCSGTNLNPGTIKKIDLDDAAGRYFEVELNSDADDNEKLRRKRKPPVLYKLRYDAVLLYADETHEDFRDFRLPARQPSPPRGEKVRVRRETGGGLPSSTQSRSHMGL